MDIFRALSCPSLDVRKKAASLVKVGAGVQWVTKFLVPFHGWRLSACAAYMADVEGSANATCLPADAGFL